MINRRCFVLGALSTFGFSRRANSSDVSVDVRNFGAFFEGRRAEHEEINAALRYAADNGIPEVRLPAGRAIVAASVRIPSGISLRGVGHQTIITAARNLNDHVVTNFDLRSGNDNISCSNFAIDGNADDQARMATSRGIYLRLVSNLLVDGVTIYNTAQHCIHISNTGRLRSVANQVVRNCVVHGAGRGAGMASSGLATSDVDDLSIINVSSYDNERAGFRLGVATRAVLMDCKAERCGDGGYVPVAGSTGIQWLRCRAIRNGATGSFDGFRLVNVQDAQMVDCVAEFNEGAGLLIVNNCSRIDVVGGVFRNNGTSHKQIGIIDARSEIAIKGHGNQQIRFRGIELKSANINERSFGLEIEDPGAQEINVSNCTIWSTKGRAWIDASRRADILCDLKQITR